MEMIYYTIAAVVLYLVSDYILNTIEIRMGKRLPSRSFFFLIIITILAMVSFSFIRAIYGPLPNKSQTTTPQVTTSQVTTQQMQQADKKPVTNQVPQATKEVKKEEVKK